MDVNGHHHTTLMEAHEANVKSGKLDEMQYGELMTHYRLDELETFDDELLIRIRDDVDNGHFKKALDDLMNSNN